MGRGIGETPTSCLQQRSAQLDVLAARNLNIQLLDHAGGSEFRSSWEEGVWWAARTQGQMEGLLWKERQTHVCSEQNHQRVLDAAAISGHSMQTDKGQKQ